MCKSAERFVIFFLILIITGLCLTIFLMNPWKYDKEDMTFNLFVPSVETFIISSEKYLPSKDLFLGEEKDRLYILYKGNILKKYFFFPRISEKIFCEKMEVNSYLYFEKKIFNPYFFIKNIFLEEDDHFLKITMGVSKEEIRFFKICVISFFLIVLILFFFLIFILTHREKKIIKNKKTLV